MPTLFILYDERAYTMGTDEASVYCCAQSLKEARRDRREMFPNAAIYEYDEDHRTDPPQLINERLVE